MNNNVNRDKDITNKVNCLMGVVVGNAVGAPYSGLSRKMVDEIFPDLKNDLFHNKPMFISCESEQAIITAQSLVESAFNNRRFLTNLTSKIKRWMLSLPIGVTDGLFRAGLKMLAGKNSEKSGVFSAGALPSVRALIIGATSEGDLVSLAYLIRGSTMLTHTDPKALYGAMAIALAARHSAKNESFSFKGYMSDYEELSEGWSSYEMVELIKKVAVSVRARQSTVEFASQLGLTRFITGYTYHVIPLVLHAWLRHPKDIKQGIYELVKCGGETNLTVSLYTGLVATREGLDDLPKEIISSSTDFAYSLGYLNKLSRQLDYVSHSKNTEPALSPNFVIRLLRNMYFIMPLYIKKARNILFRNAKARLWLLGKITKNKAKVV